MTARVCPATIFLFCANDCFFPLWLAGKFSQSTFIASKLISHEYIVARFSKMGIRNVAEILPALVCCGFECLFDVGIVNLDHELPDCAASVSRTTAKVK